jgi:hypothetical protein
MRIRTGRTTKTASRLDERIESLNLIESSISVAIEAIENNAERQKLGWRRF